jgi:hypothetical protein
MGGQDKAHNFEIVILVGNRNINEKKNLKQEKKTRIKKNKSRSIVCLKVGNESL